jgi:hypothetical protein
MKAGARERVRGSITRHGIAEGPQSCPARNWLRRELSASSSRSTAFFSRGGGVAVEFLGRIVAEPAPWPPVADCRCPGDDRLRLVARKFIEQLRQSEKLVIDMSSRYSATFSTGASPLSSGVPIENDCRMSVVVM